MSIGQEIRKASEDAYSEKRLAVIQSRGIVDANGCLIWQGSVGRFGYGQTSYRGVGARVHRLVWQLVNGPVPRKIDVCHTCDVRLCFNLEHLWLGTRSQNLQDMVDKRRGPCGAKAAKTHCDRGHPLSGDHIYTYDKHRRCKVCDRIRGRMRMGWSEEEAVNTPPIPFGQQTARRSIGVRNRGRVA